MMIFRSFGGLMANIWNFEKKQHDFSLYEENLGHLARFLLSLSLSLSLTHLYLATHLPGIDPPAEEAPLHSACHAVCPRMGAYRLGVHHALYPYPQGLPHETLFR
jgi:hypothetical protein